MSIPKELLRSDDEESPRRPASAHETTTGSAAEFHHGLIGRSEAMQRLFEQLRCLESIDAPPVLVQGESGTGKELVARALHARGARRGEPFVVVDCTSIPEPLAESVLFGHERGAFTDARAQHRGLLEAAGAGTVLLDEIGELPMALQAKLLRALESRTFRRVGGTATLPMRAAVVAATHRDLDAAVEAGRFRRDLFFRLAIVRLRVPPLRERRDDIPLLAEHFVAEFRDLYRRGHLAMEAGVHDLLLGHPWPGNVRELRNALEQAAIFARDERIGVRHLPHTVQRPVAPDASGPPSAEFVLPADGAPLDAIEASIVHQALARSGGNQLAAARLLHISRQRMRTLVARHGAPPAARRSRP